MNDTDTPIKEGSTLHYSLLWTDPQAKIRFAQRLRLIRALVTTLDDVQEPQVAEKKIHWWHEELQRMHAGEARHPATKANQDSLRLLDNAMSACLDILGVAATQRLTTFDTIDNCESELTRSFKARLALLAHALSEDNEDLLTASHPDTAALALAQHEQLIRLPGLIHRGLPVFSDESYRQFNVSPQDLAEHIRISRTAAASNDSTADARQPTQALQGIPIVTDKPGRRQLLASAIARNRHMLIEATSDSAVAGRYRRQPLLPIWRILKLRRYQLELWHQRQPDLLRERLTLTPLTKLFRSWQNRR